MPLHRIKLLVKHLLGRDLLIRRRVHILLEHYGNRYGDWSVPANYVTPESIIYSFGIGEDASWDLGLIQAKKALRRQRMTILRIFEVTYPCRDGLERV
jgi:hypothetical protein